MLGCLWLLMFVVMMKEKGKGYDSVGWKKCSAKFLDHISLS